MIITGPKKLITAVGVAAFVCTVGFSCSSTSSGNGSPRPSSGSTAVAELTSSAYAPSPAAHTPGQPMDGDSPAASAPPAGESGTPRGLPAKPKIDRDAADSVAAVFVRRLASYDTRIDNSVQDAARRAAGLATPSLAKELREDGGAVEPDAGWAVLDEHDGYTSVKTRLGGAGAQPKDSRTRAGRVVTAYVQRHGDRGWKPDPDPPQTILIILGRPGPKEPWSVTSLEYLS